jgi:hypothetical protein
VPCIIRLTGCQHSVGCTNLHYSVGVRRRRKRLNGTVDSFLRAGLHLSAYPSVFRTRRPGFGYLTAHFTFHDRETFRNARKLHSEAFDLVFLCQAARCCFLAAETRVQSPLNSREIRGVLSGTRAGFCMVFPCRSPSHPRPTLIYHRPTRCAIALTKRHIIIYPLSWVRCFISRPALRCSWCKGAVVVRFSSSLFRPVSSSVGTGLMWLQSGAGHSPPSGWYWGLQRVEVKIQAFWKLTPSIHRNRSAARVYR